MKRKLKAIIMYLLIFIGLYLIIGNLLHQVIIPEKKPDISTFFKPGQVFYSKKEGFRQTVVKQEQGFVQCTLEAEPFAPGPPKHIHTDFDETFQIENGELTIWVDGEIKKLHPGEVLLVPKGTPHKPYNETSETIRTKGTFGFPEKFAYHLVQAYGFMEHHPGFMNEPGTVFQMALLQQAGFDSYVADGPPVAIQRAIAFIANPLARLFGMRTYYDKYNVLQTKAVVKRVESNRFGPNVAKTNP